MAKPGDLGAREQLLLARIGAQREALFAQWRTLRRPLRKVERVEQSLWNASQHLQRFGGLRALLLMLVPVSMLAWRMRRTVRGAVRLWGGIWAVWRIVRGLRARRRAGPWRGHAPARVHRAGARRWRPIQLLKSAAAWRS